MRISDWSSDVCSSDLSGRYAAEQVMAEIETHKTTIVFCNTRSLAELIFQDLWKVNAMNLPIGVHHGSLAREARRKVEGAMAAGRLRALVATSSLEDRKSTRLNSSH